MQVHDVQQHVNQGVKATFVQTKQSTMLVPQVDAIVGKATEAAKTERILPSLIVFSIFLLNMHVPYRAPA